LCGEILLLEWWRKRKTCESVVRKKPVCVDKKRPKKWAQFCEKHLRCVSRENFQKGVALKRKGAFKKTRCGKKGLSLKRSAEKAETPALFFSPRTPLTGG